MLVKNTSIILLVTLLAVIFTLNFNQVEAQPNEATGEDLQKLREFQERHDRKQLIDSILEPGIPIIIAGIIAFVVIKKVVLPRRNILKNNK